MLGDKISELKDDKKINGKYLEEFEEAVNDDLNTSRALQVLWKMVRDEKTGGQIGAIKKMEEVLGLDLLKKGKKEKIPKKILDLVKEREKARKDKDWGKADEFREEIKKQGWIVGDLTNGKSGVEKLLFHNELGII